MTPSDELLSPEEVAALLNAPDEGTSGQDGSGLLEEFVHLLLAGALQSGVFAGFDAPTVSVYAPAGDGTAQWQAAIARGALWAMQEIRSAHGGASLGGWLAVALVVGENEIGGESANTPSSAEKAATAANLVNDLVIRTGRLLGTRLTAVHTLSGDSREEAPRGPSPWTVKECIVLPVQVSSSQGQGVDLYVAFSPELATAILHRLSGQEPVAATAPVPDLEVQGALSEPVRLVGRPGKRPLSVKPAAFPPIEEESGAADGDYDLERVLDLPLRLTVELGRTRMALKEIMALGPGSIIDFDRLVGEMVDVLVNGKLVAKGEVVVIDDTFGVKITDIVSPADRMRGLA